MMVVKKKRGRRGRRKERRRVTWRPAWATLDLILEKQTNNVL